LTCFFGLRSAMTFWSTPLLSWVFGDGRREGEEGEDYAMDANTLRAEAGEEESETGASDANLSGEEAGQEEAIETSATAAGREELGEED